MTKKKKQTDPIEQTIETALAPGTFISYNGAWSFVEDIQRVVKDIDNLIENETAKSLLAWMEDDPCGFCYHLDREAAKVLDKKEWGTGAAS